MTLKTASRIDLSDQAVATLTKVQAKLAELKTPRLKGRKEVELLNQEDRLVDRLIMLFKIGYSQRQLDGYTPIKGEPKLVRLDKVEDPELRAKIFKKIPNCKFKRFQQIFCDKLVVPEFVVTEHGGVYFKNNVDFKKLSVAGCIVSPDRIPEKLAQDLQLVEFEKKFKGTVEGTYGRLVQKSSIPVIEQLKLIWDSAIQVNRSNFRVLVVQRPTKDISDRYPHAPSFPIGLHGTILINREDFSDRKDRNDHYKTPTSFKPLLIQFFEGLNDAYRKTEHESRGYNIEDGALAEMKTTLLELRNRIDTQYRRDAKPEVKTQIQKDACSTIANIAQKLHACINHNKEEAKWLLSLVRDFKDTSGKINPSVTENRISLTLRSLSKRVDEIADKIGPNVSDGLSLYHQSLEFQGILKNFREKLVANAAILNSPTHLFDGKSITASFQKAEVSRILGEIIPSKNLLEKINYRPYSTFASQLRVICNELTKAVNNGRRELAKESAVKLNIVCKLYASLFVIDDMKSKVADAKEIPVSKVTAFIPALKKVLDNKIFPEITVPEYEDKFTLLTKRLDTLTAAFEGYGGKKDTVSDRTNLYKSLKKLLKDIDPEELLWEIITQSKAA